MRIQVLVCIACAHTHIKNEDVAHTYEGERVCVCVCMLEGYLLQHACAHTFVCWSCYCSTLRCWSDQGWTHTCGRNEGKLKRRWKMDRQRFWFSLLLLIQYEHAPLTKHTADARHTYRWTPERAQMIHTILIKSEARLPYVTIEARICWTRNKMPWLKANL